MVSRAVFKIGETGKTTNELYVGVGVGNTGPYLLDGSQEKTGKSIRKRNSSTQSKTNRSIYHCLPLRMYTEKLLSVIGCQLLCPVKFYFTGGSCQLSVHAIPP